MSFKNKGKIFSLTASILISSSVVASGAACVWYSAHNYVLSNEFGETNSYRIPLSGFDGEDDQRQLEYTAKNFTDYLKYKKLETYNDVKITDKEGNPYFSGTPYLQFALPVENKIPPSDSGYDNDTKVNYPAMTTLFDTLNSNNISFLMDLDPTLGSGTSVPAIPNDGTKASSVIFQPSDLLDTDRRISIPKIDNKKVVITSMTSRTVGSSSYVTKDDWNKIYHLYSATDAPSTTLNPEIFILRDKETLISRMHYILNCKMAYNDYFGQHQDDPDATGLTDDYKYFSFVEGYKFLSDDEKAWATAVYGSTYDYTHSQSFLTGSLFTNGSNYTPYATRHEATGITPFFEAIPDSTGTPVSTVDVDSSNGYNDGNDWYDNIANDDAMFYRLIDFDLTSPVYSAGNFAMPAGIAGDDANTFGSKWGSKWMTPYVLGVINKTNFTKYFPDKSPFDTSDSSSQDKIGKWFVLSDNGATISTSTAYDATLLQESLFTSNTSKKLSNTLPFEVMKESDNWVWPTNSTASYKLYGNADHSSFFNELATTTTITHVSRTLSDGWIFKDPIVGMLVGIILIIVSIGILVSVLYRVPGVLFACSLFAIVAFTLFIITLVGKLISLSVFLAILAGIIMSTASVFSLLQRMKKHTTKKDFVINAARKGATKGIWQVVDFHLISIIIGACFLYFGILPNSEFGVTYILYSLFSFGFILLWAIASLLIFWSRGNANAVNLIFNNKKMPDFDFTQTKENERETSFEKYTKAPKFNIFGFKKELISGIIISCVMITGGVLLGIYANASWLFSSSAANNDFKQILISILVIGGMLSIYALVRLNWTSVVPVFISIVATPLLMYGLIAICHLSITNNMNIVFPFFMSMNALLTFAFIGNINNKWIKQKFHSVKDLRQIIDEEIKTNAARYFIYVCGTIIGMIAILLFTSSISLLSALAFVLFGILISILVLLTLTKTSLFLFMRLRYIYKIKVTQNNFFFIKNYDNVDEQNIDNINKFEHNKITL